MRGDLGLPKSLLHAENLGIFPSCLLKALPDRLPKVVSESHHVGYDSSSFLPVQPTTSFRFSSLYPLGLHLWMITVD